MQKIKLFSDTVKVDIVKLCDGCLNEDFDTYKKLVPHMNGNLTILMFEEFLYRINSDMTVTVFCDERPEGTTVELIGSGGKVGITGASFGSEKAALKTLYHKLIELGFEEVK